MPTFEHAAVKIAYQTQGTGPPVLFVQGVTIARPELVNALLVEHLAAAEAARG